MGIPKRPMQTLATMIFDGVFERLPDAALGVIEQGAIWVPSWMRQMESAFEAFVRHEDRLQSLSLRPSEYVRRQIKATPYPTEDVGWIVDAGRTRDRAVLVRLPARRGRPPPGRALRGEPRRRVRGRAPGASTATTSSTSWVGPWTGSRCLHRGPAIQSSAQMPLAFHRRRVIGVRIRPSSRHSMRTLRSAIGAEAL